MHQQCFQRRQTIGGRCNILLRRPKTMHFGGACVTISTCKFESSGGPKRAAGVDANNASCADFRVALTSPSTIKPYHFTTCYSSIQSHQTHFFSLQLSFIPQARSSIHFFLIRCFPNPDTYQSVKMRFTLALFSMATLALAAPRPQNANRPVPNGACCVAATSLKQDVCFVNGQSGRCVPSAANGCKFLVIRSAM
jgi:hypothetical protein